MSVLRKRHHDCCELTRQKYEGFKYFGRPEFLEIIGGDEVDRTPDLMTASQLYTVLLSPDQSD
jgi:hypothetical protein